MCEIILRAGGRSRVDNEIDRPVNHERQGDILPPELELRIAAQMRNIPLSTGQEIIQSEHAIAFAEQSVAKMGADETGGSGDDDGWQLPNLARLPKGVHFILGVMMCRRDQPERGVQSANRLFGHMPGRIRIARLLKLLMQSTHSAPQVFEVSRIHTELIGWPQKNLYPAKTPGPPSAGWEPLTPPNQ